ncbi:MAG: hypothetical protein ACLR8Y_04850 [Alistipes indistinctus]
MIDSGVDVVIIATPPLFQPTHSSMQLRKACTAFWRNPLVDPEGYRMVDGDGQTSHCQSCAL